MGPWRWKLCRLRFAISSRVIVSGYRRLFWRFYWKKFSKPKITGAEPRIDLLCDWCKKVQPTTIEEIWSEAYPEGWLQRLCENCKTMCAGG